MDTITMEMPKTTLAIRIKVPSGYRFRMAMLRACLRLASFVSPKSVLVIWDWD